MDIFHTVMLEESFLYNALACIVVLFTSGITFIIWFKARRITRVISKFPGPPVNPILGNLDELLKAYIKYGNTGILKQWWSWIGIYKKHKIWRLWLSWRPVVVFQKSDVLEVLLSNQDTVEKPYFYKFFHSGLADGLITSTTNKWRTRRKLLNPTFHIHILEEYVPVFNEQSMVLVEKLKKYTKEPAMDILPFATTCTLDMICETVMGIQIHSQEGHCLSYVKALQQISREIMPRVVSPWKWNNTIFNFLCPTGRQYITNLNLVRSFTNKVIQEKKQRVLSENKEDKKELLGDMYLGRKKRKNFLDLIIHYHLNEGKFSEEAVQEEVDSFLAAGHDTTANGISWVLYNTGLYPEVQRKIHEELDSIFGEDKERSVTLDDLKEMKYLECTIKETLRLYPSVPYIARHLTSDLEIPSEKVTIPKGIIVVVPICSVHQDEEVFPNPERFDPDRFLPENTDNRSHYAYIPFSAGPRNCIGQKFAMIEEKIVVANILRHFTVRSVDPPESLVLLPEIVLHCQNGLRIEFRERVKL